MIGIGIGRRTKIQAAAAAVLGAGLLSGLMLGRNSIAADPQADRPISSAQVRQATAPLASLEEAFIAIAQKMEPSVVSIRVNRTVRTAQNAQPDIEDLFGGQVPRGFLSPFRNMPPQFRVNGSGSGVIVRPDGWIMTNDHVVDGADKVTVKLADGRELEGTVRRDFRSDIALVKVNASNLVPADMGDSTKVRVGQWSIAFGSPFELENTMTAGIVSARSRQQTIGRGNSSRIYTGLLQTDAAINPGNSGGPLVDIHGRVIGINVAIESPNGGSVGIGFAIPVNTARYVMEQLISTGKVTRGFLGLVPRALTFAERRDSNLKNGTLIESVTDQNEQGHPSPAARAGFEPGDIVTKINGNAVQDDVAFREIIAATKPGTKVVFTVIRSGKEQTLTATLDEAPDIQAAAVRQQEPRRPQAPVSKLGARLESVTPELEKKYNLGSGPAGAVVVEVEPGSPAAEAGLRPGDVIIRANGKPMATANDVTAFTGGLKSGEKVALVIFRDKTRTLLSVQIP